MRFLNKAYVIVSAILIIGLILFAALTVRIGTAYSYNTEELNECNNITAGEINSNTPTDCPKAIDGQRSTFGNAGTYYCFPTTWELIDEKILADQCGGLTRDEFYDIVNNIDYTGLSGLPLDHPEHPCPQAVTTGEGAGCDYGEYNFAFISLFFLAGIILLNILYTMVYFILRYGKKKKDNLP